MTDTLAADTKHWTGAHHRMYGMIRVDAKAFRFMGAEPEDAPAMRQTGLQVFPTRTIYSFEESGVAVKLTFMTPVLPYDLDVFSRPVTYIDWRIQSTDAAHHEVSLYIECSGEIAVNTPDQKIVFGRCKAGCLELLRIGSHEQPVLEKRGDDLRIDWGYLYLAAEREAAVETAICACHGRRMFAETGALPENDDLRMPLQAFDDIDHGASGLALVCVRHLGKIGPAGAEWGVMLAYDDILSIEYLERRLRPYWRRKRANAAEMLVSAWNERQALRRECEQFDAELMGDLRAIGGGEYAWLAALCYRQCIAAHKLTADFDGRPHYFSKENFSNGCIATIDVTYPSSPFFLLFNPELLKAQLTPVLKYATPPRWRFPFAPHDLGTYPLANGQVYGGAENTEKDQMPVEESANILIMAAAIARAEDSPDYAQEHWPLLRQWAEYVRDKGFDPENQLCTDDFAGHLAHNTNLSLKAILGLASYGMLCGMLGLPQEETEYRDKAREMAREWMRQAADGDHSRLAFDKAGTWSQKYNLVWDRILGLGVFPPEVAQREIAFYKTQQLKYGLPLDSRSEYTKLDWIVWTASLAEERHDFEGFILPLFDFANETPDRVPLTDWYWTNTGKMAGFQARSVVGGVFVPLLYDEAVWAKWRNRKRD